MDLKRDVNCTFPSISLLYKDQEGIIVKMDIIVPISYQSIPTIENVVHVFKSKVDSLVESVISFIENEVENKFALKDLPKYTIEPDYKTFDADEEKYSAGSDDEIFDTGDIDKELPNVIRIKKITESEFKLKKSKIDQSLKEICPDCGKFYEPKYLKNIHYYKCNNLPIPGVNAEGKFTCPDCGKIFSKKVYLYNHVKRLHSSEEFMCHLCDYRSKNKDYLREHLAAHEKRTWTCAKCGSTLSSKKSYQNHMRAMHTEAGQDLVPCPECGKEFKSYHMYSHMNRVHKPKKFQCTYCDYKTINNFNLKLHVSKMHLGKKELDKEECDLCGIKTTNLEYHKKIHHPF